MIRNFFIVAVMFWAAFTCQNNHRERGRGDEMSMIKKIGLILCLCLLCTKVIVHTYRHFHPPAAAIIGP